MINAEILERELQPSLDRQIMRVETLSSACADLNGQHLRLVGQGLAVPVQVGQNLDLTVKLRRPWGFRNPGGFNYRLWLLGHNIRGTGYVVSVAAKPGSGGIKPVTAELVHEPLLRALALGDRSGVSDQHWALFRDTGTIHLMIVSGLHVGVLAGLIMLIMAVSARLLPFSGRLDGLHLPAFGGIAVVTAYAVVAGLEAPVLRAALMFAIGVILLSGSRNPPFHHVLALVWCLMLLWQPNLFVRSGFWLSFVAVLVLIFLLRPYHRPQSWVRTLITAQLSMFVCMSPLVASLVGSAPLVAPVANLLVVPLMTTLVIPLAMLGFLLQALEMQLGGFVLKSADLGMHVVLGLLERVKLETLWTLGPFTATQLLLLLPVMVVWLLPLRIHERALVTAGWCLGCCFVAPPPLWGDFRITVLDVGQGSAAIVDTARRRLLVDAGPAFPSGFDTGAQVVIPALRATGQHRLDAIIVSHSDTDHVGGVAAVADQFSSTPVIAGHLCRDRHSWTWDGVRFELHRIANAANENDRSCTLVVSADSGSAFLTGDIGARTELDLKKRFSHPVDFVTAPHHGSLTSSHPAFVKSLAPGVVVFSSGFQNRYNHPAVRVVARYVRRGARPFWTYSSGAIVWHAGTGDVETYRRLWSGLYLPVVSSMN